MQKDDLIEMLRDRCERQAREIEEQAKLIILQSQEILEYKRLALISPGSACYNRNFLDIEIARITAIKERGLNKKTLAAKPLPIEYICLIFIDINGLKRINDTYGHAIGDKVIKKLGTVLNGIVRRGDIVAHIHGDEFVIVSLTNKRTDGLGLKKRIVNSTRMIIFEGTDIVFSASVGYQPTILSPKFCFEKLKDKADLKMYQEKKRIRG